VAQSEQPLFPWTRYWAPRDQAPTITDGFLVSPSAEQSWFGPRQAAALKTLAQLADVPCLVLLGDPGTGKSVEIRNEEARHRSAQSGANPAVLRVDLKRSSPDVLERDAFGAPEFLGWASGQHCLTILFDSMDECWRRTPQLAKFLLSHLRPLLAGKSAQPLFVRLSCRAAEWQSEIEEDLRNVFGEKTAGEKVQIWRLAPLCQDDVRLAATGSGLDADIFLRQVAAVDVNALAAHPVTLLMLLGMAREGKGLGKNRAEIYAAGCEMLCRDAHQSTNAAPRLRTDLQQRLACASYLAAVAALTNRYLLFGSAEQKPQEQNGVLACADLVGQEVVVRGKAEALTRELLHDTIQTGLFESQPDGLSTWRHQSYAEYLGARYLSERALSPQMLVSWICDTSAGVPRIWPQLEETACWLVTLVPDVFELLVDSNADVFARVDPARLSDTARSRIVGSYFDQIRRHEASAPSWNENVRLGRLAHPALEQELRVVLEDRGENRFVREVALDLAEACELRVLAPLCADQLLDPAELPSIRHSAGVLLRDWAVGDAIKTQAKERMTEALMKDDDDDVRGCLLSLLWPSHLTTEELIPLLSVPQRANYFGSYARFLREDLVGRMSVEMLPEFLRWVAGIESVSDHSDGDPYGGVCGDICLRAFLNLGHTEVCAEFLGLLRSWTFRDGKLLPRKERPYGAETAQRRLFWLALIATELPVRDTIIDASLGESGLVLADDFGWATEQWLKGSSSTVRERWFELIQFLFRPLDEPDHLSLIQPLVTADEKIAERVRRMTTCDLIEDGEPNWQKERYYREEEEKARLAKQKPFSDQVDEALDEYAAGKSSSMWWLMERLRGVVQDPDRTGANVAKLAWECITAEQRQRIVVAAPRYLAATTVKLPEVRDYSLIYRAYAAGLRLLVELQREKSDWPAAQSPVFWAAWAPVLFRYYDHIHISSTEPWSALFALAHLKAKTTFLAEFGPWFASKADERIPVQVLSELPVSADPVTERLLIEAATSERRERENRAEILGVLLKQGSAAAQALLESWQPRDASSPRHPNAALADAILLNWRPAVYGEPVASRLIADGAYCKAVFVQLYAGGTLRSDWVQSLSCETIARLWETLTIQYPGDPYEKDRFGLVTLDHDVYLFRNHLLGGLEGCGRDKAIDAIGGLVRRRPQDQWLGQLLARARYNCRRREWAPPAVEAVVKFLPSRDHRPLCSDGDLCDTMIASLRRYQVRLKEDNPTTELWNEPAGSNKHWAPKDENNLSDCLARYLRNDLAVHKVTAVRESELRQQTGDASGDLPDIVVYAPSDAVGGGKLKVVMEVKGAWNTGVATSITDQLHDRYMRDARCGIHVTGYFTCPSWNGKDRRRNASLSRRTFAEAQQELQATAAQLRTTTSKRVEVVVLDATI